MHSELMKSVLNGKRSTILLTDLEKTRLKKELCVWSNELSLKAISELSPITNEQRIGLKLDAHIRLNEDLAAIEKQAETKKINAAAFAAKYKWLNAVASIQTAEDKEAAQADERLLFVEYIACINDSKGKTA